MNKMRLMLNMLAVMVICLACSSLAQAQATRTWVSGVGDDANPCSRTAPCKTFAGAISKTAPCGEISVLDPGGFGGVTITKAITIDGDGTLAGILAAGVNGIIINAGVNDVVIIRSISINGQCSGLNGIRYLAGKRVSVENCSIYDFTQKAIDISHSGAGRMDIINTTITNAADGVSLQTGATNVSLFNCRINGTTNAAVNALIGTVTVSDSMITNNTSFGLIAQGGSTITAERTMIAHNGTGVSTNNAAANLNLSNTTIISNTAGITITAGTVRTFLNNSIAVGQGAPNANTPQQ